MLDDLEARIGQVFMKTPRKPMLGFSTKCQDKAAIRSVASVERTKSHIGVIVGIAM